MRLSDIFKKQSQQQKPPEIKQEPPAVKIPSMKPPAEPQKTAPSRNAEQAYTAAIVEIKNILTAVDNEIAYAINLSCIDDIIALVKNNDGDILLLADRATPDIYLYGHSVNVCILSLLLGNALGWDDKKLAVLGCGAFLHDMGMIKCMDTALRPAKLSVTEQGAVRKHVTNGQELIRIVTGISEETKTVVADIIVQTHERLNGSGYPSALKGDQINEYARVISIADVFEALTHPRPHRTRSIPHEAVKTIITGADTMFDAVLVRTFVEHISLYPPGSYVRLNTDEIARVTGINRGLPTRPRIRVLIDAAGQKAHASAPIDLASTPMIFIKEPVDESKLQFQDKKLALEIKAMRWWVKGL